MSKSKMILMTGAVLLAIGVLSLLVGVILGASGTSITTQYGTTTHTMVTLTFACLFVVVPVLGVVFLVAGAVMRVRDRKLSRIPQATLMPQQSSVVAAPQYASFWRRGAALIIDFALYQIVAGIVFLLLAWIIPEIPRLIRLWFWPYGRDLVFTETTVARAVYWAWLALAFLMLGLPLRIWGGQTLGKKLLGIRVVDQRGNDLNWLQCLARPAAYLLSMIGFIGFLWCLWDKEKRCWHDFVTRTHVVKLK